MRRRALPAAADDAIARQPLVECDVNVAPRSQVVACLPRAINAQLGAMRALTPCAPPQNRTTRTSTEH